MVVGEVCEKDIGDVSVAFMQLSPLPQGLFPSPPVAYVLVYEGYALGMFI